MIKWDKPCYKCLSHLCDLSCKQALAQPAVAEQHKQELVAIYQYQMGNGSWIDQDQGSYRYNKQHGHTVRIVYTTPPPVTESHKRPSRSDIKPLTYEQRKQMWHKANPVTHRSLASFDWYSQGVADTEAAHGITSKETDT